MHRSRFGVWGRPVAIGCIVFVALTFRLDLWVAGAAVVGVLTAVGARLWDRRFSRQLP